MQNDKKEGQAKLTKKQECVTENRKWQAHILKTIQPHFDDICSGKKTFELRKFDRDYKVADHLQLSEWDGNSFTGRYRIRIISHILTDASSFGLMDGYCILSFEH